MTANLSPWFKFYPGDWRSSRRVQAMPLATRALYLELLAEQWEHGAIPGTPEACAETIGQGSVKEWRTAWPMLVPCFPVRSRHGKLRNPKLQAITRERTAFVTLQREHGRLGAKRRWNKGQPATAPDSKPIGSLSAIYSKPIGSDGQSDIRDQILDIRDQRSEIRDQTEDLTHVHPGSTRDRPPTHAPEARAQRTRFEAFWNLYPKREAEAEAWRAWQKLNPDDGLTTAILTAVTQQRRQPNWQRQAGRYIPLPAKWLERGQWTDEPSDVPHVTDGTLTVARAVDAFTRSRTP